VLAGIAVAISLQVLAAGAAIGSMVVVLAAAFATLGSYDGEQESTWWVIFAVPLAITAVVTYVLSGFAASRVMRTGLGWLTMLVAPGVLVLLIAVASAR
jgi:hypothetical protein